MIADIAYATRAHQRPRYYANDHSRDVLEIETRPMTLIDGRAAEPTLDGEGFAVVRHVSAGVESAGYREEIAALVKELTGADHVAVNAPGVVRHSEKSGKIGSSSNSAPARFAHVDVSDPTASAFARGSLPDGKSVRRFAHYNVWRVLSAPPQDVPLTLCDAASVAPQDLIAADAIFDEFDKPEWSFEGLVVAHNPAHRWHWFPDMTPDEAIVFKTNDRDPARAHCVPHVAFDNPLAPPDAPARQSIEMRAIAYWF